MLSLNSLLSFSFSPSMYRVTKVRQIVASGYSWSPVWLKYRMHIIYLTIDDHSGTGELEL